MRKALTIGIATGALVALAGIAPASAETNNAQLSVFHGVAGLTVDVYVDDVLTLDDFTPGTLAGPLDLAAGTYTVAITASDAVDASSPAIGPIDLTLEAGKNYTAAAHLDAAGEPTATLFTNDISTTEAGNGRLTVRHIAAAPAVDVLAGDTAVVTNLENPNESILNIAAGTVSASVAATGTTAALIGPADVNVVEGANTIVYAYGSLEDDTLALGTQSITGLHSNPDGIPAGNAGLVASNTGGMNAAGLWTGAAALILLMGGLVIAKIRTGRNASAGL
jgi:hypothetical protein